MTLLLKHLGQGVGNIKHAIGMEKSHTIKYHLEKKDSSLPMGSKKEGVKAED